MPGSDDFDQKQADRATVIEGDAVLTGTDVDVSTGTHDVSGLTFIDRQERLREQLTDLTFKLGAGGFIVAVPVVMFNFWAGIAIFFFATVFIVVAHRVEDFSIKLGEYFQMKSKNRPKD